MTENMEENFVTLTEDQFNNIPDYFSKLKETFKKYKKDGKYKIPKNNEEILGIFKSNKDFIEPVAICLKNHDFKISLMEVFINLGLDIKLKYDHNTTLLNEVVYANNIEMTEYLVKNGADINACDDVYNETPLFSAIKNNNKKIIKFLIENGVNVNAKNKEGKTVYDYCNYTKNKDLKKYIKKQAKLVKSNNIALYNAIKNKSENTIVCLLENGVELNKKNKEGKTLIQILIENDINAKIISNTLKKVQNSLNYKKNELEKAKKIITGKLSTKIMINKISTILKSVEEANKSLELINKNNKIQNSI